MIGKIYKVIISYYDRKANRMSFKSRPGLIISETNGYDYDYVVLPVSRVTIEEYRDNDYDIPIKKSNYPLLNLDYDSYIRTAKQVPVSKHCIGDEIGDLKNSYPELYIDILAQVEDFNKNLINKAINF